MLILVCLVMIKAYIGSIFHGTNLFILEFFINKSAIVEISFEESKMSELKGKEKVDNGDHSWLELLLKFVACLVTEMENKMMIEKRGSEILS
ncbi:hypothetical protein GOBAR_DD32663 [Gossypium barbadense]|nr:hypothetical protein GOBAR_DD32663 [Gossypium barbadense]